jgi:GNAT superfamily N-acetyltransferase
MTRPRAAALALLFLLPSPATPAEAHHRAHPELAARWTAVRTVGVVLPEIQAFELTTKAAVARPDWAETVRLNVAAALEDELRGRGIAAKRLEPAVPAAKEELHEVQLLYESVGNAILQATYSNRFPWKLERFEYGVGDLAALLGAEGVDAALFAYGTSGDASGGRTALTLLVGGPVPGDRLFIGLVDRTGAVLWFAEHTSYRSDLKTPQGARAFVADALKQLPGAAR